MSPRIAVTRSTARTLVVFEYHGKKGKRFRARFGCVDDHDLCCQWMDGDFQTAVAAFDAARAIAERDGFELVSADLRVVKAVSA